MSSPVTSPNPLPVPFKRERQEDSSSVSEVDRALNQRALDVIKKQKTGTPSTPTLQERVSPSDFITPTAKTTIYSGASTIANRTPAEMFPNRSLPTQKDFRFVTVGNPDEIPLEKSYQLDGKKHLLVQQLTETDCGVTSFLMVYTDLIASSDAFGLENQYWRKHLLPGSFSEALNRVIPQGPLKTIGMQCQLNAIDNNDQVLHVCQRHLERTGRSIIVNISYPERNGGHFIVIDKIDQRDVYLRDPYTGKAYQVSRREFMDQTADKEVDVENFSFFTFESLRVTGK